jgi:polyisoprenoid-binding protein YceI
MLKMFTAVAIAAALPLSALAQESYTIDPYHSSVNFKVDHLGLATIHGRFSKFGGKFTLDRTAKSGGVDLSIDTASIDTGDNDKGSRPRSRDEHLRSADFFNAAEFPRMTFKSTKVVWTGDSPTAIEGNLTLLGVTRPVTLQLTRFKCNPASGNAKERCGGDARGTLKRSDFGMKRGVPSVGDDITLEIGIEADRDS